MKRVYIASDHAGYKVKSKLIPFLKSELKIDAIDCGSYAKDRVDYPDFADRVCKKMLKNPTSFGLLICGSGQGMAIRANKFTDIRAALCWNSESASLARKHNHANLLCLGTRLIELEDLKVIAKIFFTTEEEDGRHLQRVKKISKPTKPTKSTGDLKDLQNL